MAKKKTPFKVAQGRLVRTALNDTKLTQVQLGEKAGLKQSHISALLRGETGVSPEKMAAIAVALGVTVDALTPKDLGAVESESAPEPKPKAKVPAEDAMPPGLEHFLEGHADKLRITRQERQYLEHSRFRADAWVVFDDEFWGDVLAFWRAEIKKQQARR